MALLNRNDLFAALTRIGQLATADGQSIELLVVGGGIMVMEFGSRLSTRDLDGVVTNSVDPVKVRQYAQVLASEKNWPLDWLNDGAKGFLIGVTVATMIFSAPGIQVFRPAFEQLLAMKLCAWRDDVDVADARRILQELSADREAVWTLVQPFLQPGKELKARYALDDLLENQA
jgi:hypothetical protein